MAPDPILPEVLLHPHPVCCLHPPQLLVLLIHHQFLQLHVHLQPRKPESVSQARGRALGRLAVQGVVGTQQALRAVWRRPGVLEHSGQTLSSEGTGGSCSLGVLSEVGSVGGGVQLTTLALFPNSLARPLPHFRGIGEPLDQRSARLDTWEEMVKEAFGVLGWVSCLQDCWVGSACPWVSLGPAGRSQGPSGGQIQCPNRLDSLMPSRDTWGPAGLGRGGTDLILCFPREHLTARPGPEGPGAQTSGSHFISAQGAPCSVEKGPRSPHSAGVSSSLLPISRDPHSFPACLWGSPMLKLCLSLFTSLLLVEGSVPRQHRKENQGDARGPHLVGASSRCGFWVCGRVLVCGCRLSVVSWKPGGGLVLPPDNPPLGPSSSTHSEPPRAA